MLTCSLLGARPYDGAGSDTFPLRLFGGRNQIAYRAAIQKKVAQIIGTDPELLVDREYQRYHRNRVGIQIDNQIRVSGDGGAAAPVWKAGREQGEDIVLHGS